MRVKFEATDATGKVHKRGSTSRLYSHCVVIHFAAHPPSRFWPKGVTAYSRAEWAGSIALAERSASRWRKELHVEAIEILEASVMPFSKLKSHELANCFNCEADLAGNRWFESGYPTGPRVKHRMQFVDRLAYAAR
jgi:hypothetical protein